MAVSCVIPAEIAKHWQAVLRADGKCQCSDATEYPYKIQRGLKIVARCGDPAIGPYYFSGVARMRGLVRVTFFEDDGTGRPYVQPEFVPSAAFQVEGLLHWMKFETDATALRNIGAPKVKKSNPCVEAPATLDIFKMSADFDVSESSGVYIRSYRIDQVGDYSRCRWR